MLEFMRIYDTLMADCIRYKILADSNMIAMEANRLCDLLDVKSRRRKPHNKRRCKSRLNAMLRNGNKNRKIRYRATKKLERDGLQFEKINPVEYIPNLEKKRDQYLKDNGYWDDAAEELKAEALKNKVLFRRVSRYYELGLKCPFSQPTIGGLSLTQSIMGIFDDMNAEAEGG